MILVNAINVVGANCDQMILFNTEILFTFNALKKINDQ